MSRRFKGRSARARGALLLGLASLSAGAAISFAPPDLPPRFDTTPAAVASGDLDGDGDIDLVLAINGAPSQLWINQGGAQRGSVGTFRKSPQLLGRNASIVVALADLDRDGDLDIFFLEDSAAGSFSVWINQGGLQGGTIGNFVGTPPAAGHELSLAVALGDVDGNPGLDAFVARGTGKPSEFWTGTGDGRFVDSGQRFTNPAAVDVALGDLDGDFDLDAFVVNDGPSQVWINQGGAQHQYLGAFLDSGQRLGSGGPFTVALGDVDRDGDLDAVIGTATGDQVWLNQGGAQHGVAGRFADSGQSLGPGTGKTRDVALNDLDRDGDLDAVMARTSGCRIYLNDGQGKFTDAGLELGAGLCTGVALADLDNDGYSDLVLAAAVGTTNLWFNRSGPPRPTRPRYTVEAFAGTGADGDSGDNGPATLARLADPLGLGVDAPGNVYIADNDQNRIRRVDTNGVITPFAGTGVAGFGGDGGPATQALLSDVTALTADAVGNVWVADRQNHRIRRIDTQGIITTVAGSGAHEFSGDGGPAVAAGFSLGGTLTVDSRGNLYFADPFDYRIRRVGTDGIIDTVAGTGTAGSSGDDGPGRQAQIGNVRGLATDPAGNLYLADSDDHVLRRLGRDGKITRVAGLGVAGFSGDGGPALGARLNGPSALTFDAAGNLFFADDSNFRVRRIDTNGTITTVAGNGIFGFGSTGTLATSTSLPVVSALAIDGAGNVYVGEGRSSHQVRRLAPTGIERLVPHLQSSPPPGTRLDLLLGASEDGAPASRALVLGNSGASDLTVQTIEFTRTDPNLTFSVSRADQLRYSPPHVIPEGYHDRGLTVTVGCSRNVPGVSETVLRVRTDDPLRPVTDYPVRCTFDMAVEYTLEVAILSLFQDVTPPKPALANTGTDAEDAPDDLGSVTFLVDTNAPTTLASAIPAHLGGGAVTISNFTGSVTVSSTALPNDDTRRFLAVRAGQFYAPEFALPSGQRTGTNSLTFDARSPSHGFLVRSNGQYTLTATATIRNDLFPGGLPIVGNYSGTFDPTTRRASARSQSYDLVPKPGPLTYFRAAGDLWLSWKSPDVLETAPTLLGPWQPVASTTTPFKVTLQLAEQFFRVKP